MKISVVIRSKDEADRLRLSLASLLPQVQKGGHEIIVVNDGSTDHTDEVLAEASTWGPLSTIKNGIALGRSAASNAGAFVAKGEILLFLDGDVIVAPNFLEAHQLYHSQNLNIFARGETRHLRCTRTFLNPELAIPFPQERAAFQARPPKEIDRLKVTVDQIRHDFISIDQRSSLSIYSGIQPQLLFNLEVGALIEAPDCSVLWAATSGQNTSMPREPFLQVNGFDEKLEINEQRELAYRMFKKGIKFGYIPDAKSYHMLHRSGWRNPMEMPDWEKRFLALHPSRAVALLNVFWATIANPNQLPAELRIHNLLELERANLNEKRMNYDEARLILGLEPLGSDFWLSGVQ